MKRSFHCLLLSLLLAGCVASQPAQEIAATFRSFLMSVTAGDEPRILSMAPFLSDLSRENRASAIQSFQRLARTDPKRITLKVSHGTGAAYLLTVSIRGEAGAIVIPFRRDDKDHWVMSPVIEEVRHIDVVPAR